MSYVKMKAQMDRICELLEGRKPAPAGVYRFFIHNKAIELSHNHTPPTDAHMIITLGAQDINLGLNGHQWDDIRRKIRNYQKEGLL